MKKWYWSYAIHLLIWAVLAILALQFKLVAQAPILVMFLVAYLPYMIIHALGGSETDRRLISSVFFAYQVFWLTLGLAWLGLGIRRWRERKAGFLLAIPHAVIAFAGWFTVLLVGHINFPFVL